MSPSRSPPSVGVAEGEREAAQLVFCRVNFYIREEEEEEEGGMTRRRQEGGCSWMKINLWCIKQVL